MQSKTNSNSDSNFFANNLIYSCVLLYEIGEYIRCYNLIQENISLLDDKIVDNKYKFLINLLSNISCSKLSNSVPYVTHNQIPQEFWSGLYDWVWTWLESEFISTLKSDLKSAIKQELCAIINQYKSDGLLYN